MKKEYSDTLKFVTMVSQKNSWELHPEKVFFENIVNGLTKNYNRYGYYSCPCRDAEAEREKDKDIICPCEYCRSDQEEFGHCYCGLYILPGFLAEGHIPVQIPERRPYK
jgi:ferredoxin-thioredoxin reductase catalytic chain